MRNSHPRPWSATLHFDKDAFPHLQNEIVRKPLSFRIRHISVRNTLIIKARYNMFELGNDCHHVWSDLMLQADPLQKIPGNCLQILVGSEHGRRPPDRVNNGLFGMSWEFRPATSRLSDRILMGQQSLRVLNS
jgi:hypothetical protein